MSDGPDYTKYDREELLDALAHLDAARFPEREAALRRELAVRAEVPEPSLLEVAADAPAWIRRIAETLHEPEVELDVERRRVRIDGVDAFGFDDVEAVTVTRRNNGEEEIVAVWIKPRDEQAVRYAQRLGRAAADRLATELAGRLGVDNVQRL